MKKLFMATILLASILFAQSPIPAGAKLEKVFSGGQQLEGPVWKDGVGLLFSDIRAAKIYVLPANGGSVQTYLAKSDSSNGLTLDKNGNLILTQMGKRRVSRQEKDGTTITVLADKYLGKRFNSPNDIVVKSDGSIFFTDPDWNIPFGGTKEILVNGVYVKGIYRISPKGNLTLLDASYDKPNGICFSLDEKKLYVNESSTGEIFAWDVVNDSTIANKTLFNKVSPTADGMKIDEAGNVYCTGSGGISIFSPAGVLLDKIVTTSATTENPSNLAWGDADKKTLYITTNKNLLKIRMVTTGVERQGSNIPNDFKLEQNYPNPFNPTTNISYRLSASSHVTLKIYNTLGKEIDTLINQKQQAGFYNYQLTTNNYHLSSGVYFYTLTAGNFTQTHKMVVMK